jgi:predicted MPP superfamily phosphohydrolase
MKKEVPDFIVDEETRVKKVKARARRDFFKKLAIALSAIIPSAFYLRFEANWLEVTRKKVVLPKLKNKTPLKLLHLSDLHFSQSVSLDDIDFSLREGFSLSPDLCVITGDFITDKKSDYELDEMSKLLRKYTSKIPTFASLGNHDGGEWASNNNGFQSSQKVEDMLRKGGIKLLHNRNESIYIKGQPLSISGVGDLWSKTCLPHKCLTKTNSSAQKNHTILLCHNPDAKELLEPYDWDLLLCGHTHGGQLTIPFVNLTPFAPVRDHSIVEGLHSWKGRQIHVTRGVGNLWGIRLNCRPEVSLLELSSV